MIQTRAYDNEHGDPTVVMVVTGTHDVSRFVSLMAGNRMAVTEQGIVAARMLKQIRRHNGGRAALSLLKRHGGPDFSEPEPGDAAKPDGAITTHPTAAIDHACDSPYECEGIKAGTVYECRSTPPEATGNQDPHWDHRLTCRACGARDGRAW
jgi:hypothetical protein